MAGLEIDLNVGAFFAQNDGDLNTLINQEFCPVDHFENSNENDQTVSNVKIGPQHFDLLKLIGEGAFGKVLLVQNCLDKEFYAMKVISKKLLRKKNNVQYMKSERDILASVEHPFIVALHFAFQSETKLFLVMDFLAGGEFFFHLKRRGLILEKEVKFYMGEMVLAIEFLHLHGIIHRDLKPENILLRSDGHVCITDFGLAIEIGDGKLTRTLCGTSEYMAPEMLTRNGYGKAVDWWALGALCYEMLSGKPPFVSKNQKELDRKILSEKFVVPQYLTGNAASLLKGLLEKDMNKRLGAVKSTMFTIGGVTALKQHCFFEGLDWTALERLELDPPIDLKMKQAGKSNTTQSASIYQADKHNDCSSTAINNGGGGGMSELDLVTSYFDEGFTGRPISWSVVEDTVSSTNTPVRSHANSKCDGGTPAEETDEFSNFEFHNDISCTTKELQEFEDHLEQRLQKVAKKRVMRAKKEAAAALAETERKAKEEQEKAARRIEEEVKRQQAQEQAARKHAQKVYNEKVAQLKTEIAERQRHNKLVRDHQEFLSGCQKKLKALRKKIRDVMDLEEKVAAGGVKLSKEQTEKLARKQELEDQIEATVVEEQEHISTSPGDLVEEFALLALSEEESRCAFLSALVTGYNEAHPLPTSKKSEPVAEPSAAPAVSVGPVPSPEIVVSRYDHTHQQPRDLHQSGSESAHAHDNECCKDRLNSGSIDPKKFKEQQDEWVTLTKSTKIGNKKR